MLSEHSAVKSAGIERTGAVSSTTDITCEEEEELPASSVAVQVRVNVYSPLQEPGEEVSTNEIVTPSQLSEAVASAGNGTLEHSAVASPGTPDNTGAVVS